MPLNELLTPERIYLDHNATTRVDGELCQKIPEWLAEFGNPSSLYYEGQRAKARLKEARLSLSRYLNCHPLEIVFTSGGSESNNMAIKGVLGALRRKNHRGLHLVTSRVEHPSVKQVAESLASRDVRVTYLPVSREGFLDLDAYERALEDSPSLVSVMLANNETGQIFPIREMAAKAHAKGALFHTDAVQGLGKTKIDLNELGVDLASFSGHKFYALRGVGALYVRRGVEFERLIEGGSQERRRRAGTENLLAIRSLGFMTDKALKTPPPWEGLAKLRDDMEASISRHIPDVSVVGGKAPRLGNTSNLKINGVHGESLLMSLDLKGISVSTGSACSSGSSAPSPVLLAMGFSADEASSCLRISLGWQTTREEIEKFVAVLESVVGRLRRIARPQRVKEPHYGY